MIDPPRKSDRPSYQPRAITPNNSIASPERYSIDLPGQSDRPHLLRRAIAPNDTTTSPEQDLVDPPRKSDRPQMPIAWRHLSDIRLNF
ncbi:MAG: hypothetical protein F6K30_29325 [Cyanothece sp. SIO2G6]|nr:hypothetical protein [Cyanothece sp. SIO2G6]